MTSPRVMIVDDSALMRQILTKVLEAGGCSVVATAADPMIAAQKVMTLKPDVITLDVEMPRVNGLEFLERLMRQAPTPVVMVSSLTQRGADVTLRALELGAIDFVTKPALDLERGMEALATELIAKVRVAASSRVGRRAAPSAAAPVKAAAALRTTHSVICLGASTGGTEAIKQVLCALPPDSPGVVIVQHMPEHFTRQFAARLDELSSLRVAEAREGERVLTGHAYVAPGGRHLCLRRNGAEYTLHLNDGPLVHHCRPAVDVLFQSAAEALGPNAVAAVLTGMGADGAAGLKAMRDAGARTLAQDEATSVVYGMPKAAFAAGGVERVVPLDSMASAILEMVKR